MQRQLVMLGSVVVIMSGLLAGAQQFEVASIRQNLSDDRRSFSVQPGGRLVVRNVALRDLIAAAYDMADIGLLVPDRILGGPEWIETERYDIEAKASAEFQFAPGGPPRDAILMLRSLLEDRFKLVARRETRDQPIFELVVARPGQLGPGLRQTGLDCDALFASGRPPVPAAPRQPGEPPPCRLIGGPARTIASAVTMQQLAANLSNHLGRFVVDRTGLTDRYDFNLAWTPDRLPAGAPPPGIPPVDPNGPPLVTALQEQLGLKVEPARGPVEVLVIDRVERPTPN
ncbi:MAG: TIGR03435 family protein [Vicinamibacterales bacterium]